MRHGRHGRAGLGVSILFLVHHCSDQLLQLVNTVVDTVRCFGVLRRRCLTDVRARERKTSIDACSAWVLPVTLQLSPTTERARHDRFISPAARRYNALRRYICAHLGGISRWSRLRLEFQVIIESRVARQQASRGVLIGV
jgi:hypothetical protein